MNNKFTVEEVNLICVFEFRSRTKGTIAEYGFVSGRFGRRNL